MPGRKAKPVKGIDVTAGSVSDKVAGEGLSGDDLWGDASP